MCCFCLLILLHLPSARFPEMSRLVPKRNVSDRSAKFRRSSRVHMQRPMRGPELWRRRDVCIANRLLLQTSVSAIGQMCQ
ncbi:hypothetical protein NP493_2500g00018 [Ridgeia piscesae]|uniref:Secreted protein n=1 Tax=Ridgeia piscesae TaxID=27915 RepID=A0AAD9JGB0_RIDPI|nr:hypothetical protein NP493_2500g00018 [Ridgeia piscesae]